MRNNNFKKAIFDLDKTLVNTAALMPFVDCIKAHPSGTEGNRKAWREHDKHVRDCALYDGMNEVFSFIISNQVEASIVSNSVKRRIKVICEAFNIPVTDDKMIGRFSVCRFRGITKPDTRIFNRAIELLETTPDNVISFGNCGDDILVAHKAGVESVACLWGATEQERRDMLAQKPTYVISNPTEIISLLSPAQR